MYVLKRKDNNLFFNLRLRHSGNDLLLNLRLRCNDNHLLLNSWFRWRCRFRLWFGYWFIPRNRGRFGPTEVEGQAYCIFQVIVDTAKGQDVPDVAPEGQPVHEKVS